MFGVLFVPVEGIMCSEEVRSAVCVAVDTPLLCDTHHGIRNTLKCHRHAESSSTCRIDIVL